MAYSQELIKAVKEAYPDYPKVWELADQGSPWLGRYLDDSAPTGIPIDTVLTSTSLDELRTLAFQYKKKSEVYKMWCKEDPRLDKNQ